MMLRRWLSMAARFDWFRLDDYSLSFGKLNLVITTINLVWVGWLQTSFSLKPPGRILRYHTGIMSRWWPSTVDLLVLVGWFLLSYIEVELVDPSHLPDMGQMATNISETAGPNSQLLYRNNAKALAFHSCSIGLDEDFSCVTKSWNCDPSYLADMTTNIIFSEVTGPINS